MLENLRCELWFSFMNRRMCFSRLRRVTTLFDSSVYACKLLERILKLVLKLAVFYTRLSHSARTKAARKTEKATNWKNPWLWLFQNKRCHRFLFFSTKERSANRASFFNFIVIPWVQSLSRNKVRQTQDSSRIHPCSIVSGEMNVKKQNTFKAYL